MEYVHGSALSTVMRTPGCLPADDAVALVIRVADGLAAAHAAGLICRDIKPSNIAACAAQQYGAARTPNEARFQLGTVTDFA